MITNIKDQKRIYARLASEKKKKKTNFKKGIFKNNVTVGGYF